jgi:hypothetical protein
MTRSIRRHRQAAIATIALTLAVAVESPAQSGDWRLVVPPLIPEKRALIRVYAAGSPAEVRAAVDGLPGDAQVLLVTKVYAILSIPAATARTEALLDALQDTSAPVSRWRQIGAFDSAEACERQRRLALESLEGEAFRARSGFSESAELSDEHWTILEGLSTGRMSRCVPVSAFVAR